MLWIEVRAIWEILPLGDGLADFSGSACAILVLDSLCLYLRDSLHYNWLLAFLISFFNETSQLSDSLSCLLSHHLVHGDSFESLLISDCSIFLGLFFILSYLFWAQWSNLLDIGDFSADEQSNTHDKDTAEEVDKHENYNIAY
jgi:hypothetical protein